MARPNVPGPGSCLIPRATQPVRNAVQLNAAPIDIISLQKAQTSSRPRRMTLWLRSPLRVAQPNPYHTPRIKRPDLSIKQKPIPPSSMHPVGHQPDARQTIPASDNPPANPSSASHYPPVHAPQPLSCRRLYKSRHSFPIRLAPVFRSSRLLPPNQFRFRSNHPSINSRLPRITPSVR